MNMIPIAVIPVPSDTTVAMSSTPRHTPVKVNSEPDKSGSTVFGREYTENKSANCFRLSFMMCFKSSEEMDGRSKFLRVGRHEGVWV